MSRLVAASVLAFALAPSSAFAQFRGMGGMGGMAGAGPNWPSQEWTVKVETLDGKTVSGTLALKEVAVECDFGVYHIRPEKVRSIQFTNQAGQPMIVGPGGAGVKGVVSTSSGESIGGTVLVPGWMAETDLGAVVVNPAGLKSVTLTGKVDRPAEPNKNEPKKK